MRYLPLVLLLLAACGASAKVTLTPEEERVLRPVPDPPEGVQSLVERGDRYFLSAIPEKDPQAALGLYAKARSAYLEAQTHYSGLVPPPLLDRVKECVNRIAALQRQKHAAPQ